MVQTTLSCRYAAIHLEVICPAGKEELTKPLPLNAKAVEILHRTAGKGSIEKDIVKFTLDLPALYLKFGKVGTAIFYSTIGKGNSFTFFQ